MKPYIQFSSRFIKKSNDYYLSFSIDDNKFAANFPIIIGFSREYQYLPVNMPSSIVLGIALVNNEFVPIIDLKRKLGFNNSNTKQSNSFKKIIIIETTIYETNIKFGIPYDNLGDAFEIEEKKLSQFTYESSYIKGVHVHNNDCILVINFDKLINIDDLIDIKISPSHISLQ